MTDEIKNEVKKLRQDAYLLREELTGTREMLDGAMATIRGAQKAYAAVSQRADLLEERIKYIKNGGF